MTCATQQNLSCGVQHLCQAVTGAQRCPWPAQFKNYVKQSLMHDVDHDLCSSTPMPSSRWCTTTHTCLTCSSACARRSTTHTWWCTPRAVQQQLKHEVGAAACVVAGPGYGVCSVHGLLPFTFLLLTYILITKLVTRIPGFCWILSSQH